ncbi:MAG: hypothetical protein ACI3XJ_02390 [Oscillospiraceae bacterium]
MRKHKFILITVFILLVGALTAGLAARAVVTPRMGETISAGVLSVPSVLGQTAEEVLFYPWPMYETQTLFPLSEDYRDLELQTENSRLFLLLGAYGSLGISYDYETLLGSLLWNVGDKDDPTQINSQLFLKDFPAILYESQTPVILDFALSETAPSSVSYLVRPLETHELTEEQQQAALLKVKSDLAKCLLSLDRTESDLAELLFSFSEHYEGWKITEFFSPLEQLYELLHSQYGSVQDAELENASDYPSLEDILAERGTSGPCTIQLITTPQQIVILFNLDNGSIFGTYYDVQLERYSGFGMSI